MGLWSKAKKYGKKAGMHIGTGGLSAAYDIGKSFTKKDKNIPTSTLTAEQQAQLAALTGKNIGGYDNLFNQQRSLAYNPQNDYQKMNNWEGEFNAGVVNPALTQMNQLIVDTRHSSNLHSSANRYAQDQIRQKTSDMLAGARYDQLMKERNMRMQGQEAARARQQAALSGLGSLSSTALGVQGIENIYKPGRDWFDVASLGVSGLAALK